MLQFPRSHILAKMGFYIRTRAHTTRLWKSSQFRIERWMARWSFLIPEHFSENIAYPSSRPSFLSLFGPHPLQSIAYAVHIIQWTNTNKWVLCMYCKFRPTNRGKKPYTPEATGLPLLSLPPFAPPFASGMHRMANFYLLAHKEYLPTIYGTLGVGTL